MKIDILDFEMRRIFAQCVGAAQGATLSVLASSIIAGHQEEFDNITGDTVNEIIRRLFFYSQEKAVGLAEQGKVR